MVILDPIASSGLADDFKSNHCQKLQNEPDVYDFFPVTQKVIGMVWEEPPPNS